MKTILIIAALAASTASFSASPAQAGAIERACLGSDRKAANRALCGCIQQVADLTLDRRDQRLAARFFKDPHKAQEVRQSKKGGDSLCWRKYRQFGDTATAYCS